MALVVVVVVAVVGIRSCLKKRINEIPTIQMPLLTPMAMTPNPEPVFPSPTDDTDPSSTVVPGVYVPMSWLYGCLGGCTGVWMHGCIAVYGWFVWCTTMPVDVYVRIDVYVCVRT